MINQVTLVGRLTRDPELRYTQEGKAVANITLAVSRHYRNQSGEIESDFVHCTIWNKTAENTANYCQKGSVIGITGRIQTRSYDNQEGRRVYVTEVVAENVRFLSSKPAAVPIDHELKVPVAVSHGLESSIGFLDQKKEALPFE
ncbi:single-stranded DNA-binding protein [Mesobacillus harenae]|uniref:single-stranded DNA-binding protein n=1 Tax=Mesobacillus harenae TaxID=2213203 RepID=UPI001580D51C|nr:single-stranded DNA-binding protein [Mesobacillus harenae]